MGRGSKGEHGARKGWDLLKGERYEERVCAPRLCRWATVMKATGKSEAGGMEVILVYLTLGLEGGLWLKNFFVVLTTPFSKGSRAL